MTTLTDMEEVVGKKYEQCSLIMRLAMAMTCLKSIDDKKGDKNE
jgi:hypothetical protein